VWHCLVQSPVEQGLRLADEQARNAAIQALSREGLGTRLLVDLTIPTAAKTLTSFLARQEFK